jgi:hypothetical protein
MTSVVEGSSARREEIVLSLKGMERAGNVERGSFTFICGEKKWKCNRFQASFISGVVSRLLESEAVCDQFIVEGVCDSGSTFEEVMSLMNGAKLVLS